MADVVFVTSLQREAGYVNHIHTYKIQTPRKDKRQFQDFEFQCKTKTAI